MKVVLVDAGISNVHSITKALLRADESTRVSTDLSLLPAADRLVLPGVGAFGAAAQALAPVREDLRAAIAGGLPTLGICLGMQLLFARSAESPGEGLAVLPGDVRVLPTPRRPHMGWSRVQAVSGSAPIALEWAYFAHSFACAPADPAQVWARTTQEGITFPAAVRAGSVWGVQFHPEKSSAPGIAFLRQFLEES